jgi:ribosome-associated translation inhibitor RaiA
MRIDIIDEDDSTTAQARVYAEYRLFATLARYARAIRSVRAVLHVERRGVADRATCVVTVVLDPSGSAVVRAHGRHVHGAIDRAAGRIRDLINRRPLQITPS